MLLPILSGCGGEQDRYRVIQRPDGDAIGPGRPVIARAAPSWPEYRIDLSNPVKMSKVGNGSIVLTYTKVPGGSVYHDPAGRFDGSYVLWYSHGPFRGLKAAQLYFKDGNLTGTVTFWDKHGHVVEQFNSESQSKTSPPWWDGVQDQSPKDGVYTEVGTLRRGYGNPLFEVEKQWEYRDGRMVGKASPPKMPSEGFWRVYRGRIVRVDGLDKSSFFLDGRPLHEGDMLRLAQEEASARRVQYNLAVNNARPEPSLNFVDADVAAGIAAGQTESYFNVRGFLSWP